MVHGSPIDKDAERAAIYLAEDVVPLAERFARKLQLKVLESYLEGLFKDGERVEKLFDKLLFSDSVDAVLAKVKR